jgi:hypothetical protein
MDINSIQNTSAIQSYSRIGTQNGQTSSFKSVMSNRLSQIENAANSGQIDTAKMQEKLQGVFGDAVNGAFGEDGSVDFDELKSIIKSELGSKGRGNFPGMMGGGMMPGGIGNMMSGGLVSLMSSNISNSPMDLGSKLLEVFGEEVEGIVNEDGDVDKKRLQELVEKERSAGNGNSQGFFEKLSSLPTLSKPVFVDAKA